MDSRQPLDLGTSEADVLPLFPELRPFTPAFDDNENTVFADPFLSELTLSNPVQRLKRIGFLGAIDYVRFSNGHQSHRRRHNRFDHSIGVAQLALLYSDIRGLTRPESRVLAAAGLLHDIGHGPLSHTLEPIFSRQFGINHHMVGEQILRGSSPFGGEIMKILAAYKVDLDEVVAMLDGTHAGRHSYLFSGPINLDTVEGISRARAFVARSFRPVDPRLLVTAMAESDELPLRLMDDFWQLKHEIYNLVIHNPWGLIFDGLAQAFMDFHIEDFGAEDFLKTEDQLRHKKPVLFHIFAWAKTSKRRAYHRVSEMVPALLSFDLQAPKRTFTVAENIIPETPMDLRLRYVQHKSKRGITIGDLVKQTGAEEEKD